MLPEAAPTRSAHHGDFRAPNQLEPALLVADRHPEVQIFEIDFVDAGGPQKRLVSSHDYDERAIALGSELEQWIDALVVKRRRVLWLDCKQNLDLYFAYQYTKFHPRRLMRRLEAARKRLTEEAAIDLTRSLWLGSQDCQLRAQLLEENEKLEPSRRWRFILDMPTVRSYVWQRLAPRCCQYWVDEDARLRFRDTEYHQYDLISLDRTFFTGPAELKLFLRSLHLRPGVVVVLNSFDRRQEPIVMEDLAIVMQYDYSEQPVK